MFGFGKKKERTPPTPQFNIGDQVKIIRGWEKPVGLGKVENRKISNVGSGHHPYYIYIYLVNGEEFWGSELELKTPVDVKAIEAAYLPPSSASAQPSIVDLLENFVLACVVKHGQTINVELKLPPALVEKLDLSSKPMATVAGPNSVFKSYHMAGGTVTFK